MVNPFKANGKMILLKVKELLFILMGMLIKDHLLIIWPMDRADIFSKVYMNIQVSLKMINSMVKEKNIGLTNLIMLVSMSKI